MQLHASRLRRAALRGRLAALPLLLAGAARAQSVIYVDDSATGADDGSSWADAYDDLSVALDNAVADDEVWVATGTYRSTHQTITGDARSVSFVVRNRISVYGGFAGTEATRDERAGLFTQTILTGELQSDGVLTNNAYHVVTIWGLTVFDGFLVERGYADEPTNPVGGGIFCTAGPNNHLADLLLANCTLRYNTADVGGGFFQPGGETLMKRTRIMRNTAGIGGGMAVGATHLVGYNCEFGYNAASSLGGGLRLTSTSEVGGTYSVFFANTLIHHNTAEFGGGVYLGDGEFWDAHARFDQSTISVNSASDSGGGIYAANSSSTPASGELLQSIVWGNTAGVAGAELSGTHVIANCDAPGGSGVSFYSDPLFVSGTFKLSPSSPCIDHGNTNLVPNDFMDVDDDGDPTEDLPIDYEGDARVLGNSVDLGYDEYSGG